MACPGPAAGSVEFNVDAVSGQACPGTTLPWPGCALLLCQPGQSKQTWAGDAGTCCGEGSSQEDQLVFQRELSTGHRRGLSCLHAPRGRSSSQGSWPEPDGAGVECLQPPCDLGHVTLLHLALRPQPQDRGQRGLAPHLEAPLGPHQYGAGGGRPWARLLPARSPDLTSPRGPGLAPGGTP